MRHGGRAWRGWFPLGGELTSGRPDGKEGCYFGAELGPDDPRVRAAAAARRRTCSPPRCPSCATAVLEHLDAMTALGQAILRGMALGLGLPAGVVRRAPHRRPARAVPHLPLPAAPPSRDDGVGRGRAHRLRPAHDPAPGRSRRPRGAHARRVGRRAADPGLVRVQPRRHARAPHRRPLPLHAPPRPQPRRRPTACRSRSSSTPAGTPRSCRSPSTSRGPAGAGPAALGRRRRRRRRRPGTYGEYLMAKVGKVFPDLGTSRSLDYERAVYGRGTRSSWCCGGGPGRGRPRRWRSIAVDVGRGSAAGRRRR